MHDAFPALPGRAPRKAPRPPDRRRRLAGDGDGEGDSSWRRKTGSCSSRKGESGGEERGDDSCVVPLIVRLAFGGEGKPMEGGGEESGEEICERVVLMRERSYMESAQVERGGEDSGEDS